MTPLAEHEKKNFETFQEAWDDGNVGMVRTRLVEPIPAGTEVAVLAGFLSYGEEVGVTPFAMMIPGNPYEMLADPTEDD